MRLPESTRPRGRKLAVLVAVAALAISLPAGAFAARPATAFRTIDLQILDISDWHGQLDPVSITGVGNVGGAAVLKAYFDAARAQYAHNLTLTAGDDVGATPPLANYFEDIPSILAQRMMGIQIGSFGNHNFDYGLERTQEQIDLAGSTDPSVVGSPFRYVSANLSNRDTNISGVSDYAIFAYQGVRVAVIGITNEEAPTLNFPGAMGTMLPTDSVAAAMAAKAAAAAEGAKIFIAITHKGVTSFNAGQPAGELIDFANGVEGFDIIFGDHTDIQYSGVINDQFVVENRSKGVSFSKTVLTINRGTGNVMNRVHTFVTPLESAVTPDAGIQAMLAPYRTLLQPIFGGIVGYSTVQISRTDSCGGSTQRLCEGLNGNVITDALRETYGVDFALMNSGGIRSPLTCPVIDNGADFCPAFVGTPYPITRGQVNTDLPFGNISITITLTGAQVKAMLENGVSFMPAANGRFAQVSGLCFTYNIEAAPGSRVTGAVRQAGDGTCTGPAVDLTAGTSYTFATNEFVAAGGDGFPVLTGFVSFNILDQDVSDWLTAKGTISPTIQGRITCTDPNPGVGNNCPVALP